MAAVLVQASAGGAPAWFWFVCVAAILAIPALEGRGWRRMACALLVAIVIGSAGILAALCPVCDECCPDYVAYGICWPIGWWPC
jgi:hypothetical protein